MKKKEGFHTVWQQ